MGMSSLGGCVLKSAGLIVLVTGLRRGTMAVKTIGPQSSCGVDGDGGNVKWGRSGGEDGRLKPMCRPKALLVTTSRMSPFGIRIRHDFRHPSMI